MIFKVYLPDKKISNILLKKCILWKNIKPSLLLNAQAELKLAYKDFGDNFTIINNTLSFFKYAIFEKELYRNLTNYNNIESILNWYHRNIESILKRFQCRIYIETRLLW